MKAPSKALFTPFVVWLGLITVGPITTGCVGATATEAQTVTADHRDWDAVLKKHVSKTGLVDYAAIAADPRFQRYVEALESADPKSLPTDRDRLAFWINAYNAVTIRGILKVLPDDKAAWSKFKPTSVNIAGNSFWKGYHFTVAGRKLLTLDKIEHEIIRQDARFKDPRIHVALVCAARGCPPLLNEAYRGAKLETQLHARMTKQIRDAKRTKIDAKAKRLTLSKVFEWYGKDFTDKTFKPRAASLAAFVASYVEDKRVAASLRSGGWTVDFPPYDWRLNLRPKSAAGK